MTPCSFAPISASHIQNGRLSSTAWVWRTCPISIHVHRTLAPAGWLARGCQSRNWASFGSRSEFLANSTDPGRTTTMVSHMVPSQPGPGKRTADGHLPNRIDPERPDLRASVSDGRRPDGRAGGSARIEGRYIRSLRETATGRVDCMNIQTWPTLAMRAHATIRASLSPISGTAVLCPAGCVSMPS